MYWRFGPGSGDPAAAPLLYEICAFLEVLKGTRIKGHVDQLRKKIAECGLDPKLVIAHATHQGGYSLAHDVDASMLVEADALALIDKLLARPETADPTVRDGLAQLRMLLTVGPLLPPREPHHVVSLSDGSSVRRDTEGYVIRARP